MPKVFEAPRAPLTTELNQRGVQWLSRLNHSGYPMANEDAWHLDKKVPLAFIVTILLQTAGIVWWGSSISERMNSVEREQQDQRAVVTVLRESLQTRGERIAALEAGQRAILDALRRIDSKLDRLPGG